TPPTRDSYYPLELGQQWVYDTRVYGPQPRSTVSTTAVCRIRLDEDGDLLHLVSTCADGELVQAQFVYQLGSEIVEPIVVNAGGEARPRDPPVTIARLQMRVGDSWRWVGRTDADEPERTDRYRVANRGRVWTEAGEFEAVRVLVTQEGPNATAAAVERWYAPGVGLVKEAGVALFPIGGGRAAPIELVRTLKERAILPVESIPCCSKQPGG
ncbi:MAG TPA: hypothetical protein VG370_04715, partial [Chloroflexota bacterium]|nr:hypothetical protein [Chloroflexota bacterium]